MPAPCDLSAVEARRLIGVKQLSPVELLESCLQRADATNGALNSIVARDDKAARAAAKAAERAVLRGDDLGLLHGLPTGIKDLEATAGLTTTWGSLIYKGHVPEADDPSVANVRAEGAVILGKTNTPEFGAGAQTTNRVYGATGNPFDPTLTCAGSSGGSAVALATGQAMLASGSDYAGSLRTPSAFCGVVGFRPSPGLVPGTTRAASLNPFSQLGPMGRTVADAHLLFRAQRDTDSGDPFSSGDAFDLPDQLTGADLGSVRMAWTTDFGQAPVDRAIADVFRSRIRAFGHVFAEAGEATPDFAGIHEVFDVFRGLNFVAAHRDRLEKHRDLLGPNVISNTEAGLKYSLADVARAHVAQTALYRRFLAFFDDVDVIIAPAAAVSPFPHSQLFVTEINGEKMPSYTRWMSLAYIPTMMLACAACIPCGVDHKGLPFGIQIVAPKRADAMLWEIALSLEQVLAGMPETRRPVPDLGRLRG
jgi:Asp-tRNA(Asn)/Glu-tRNA(Gln) amidotransferase A subunit family amidase